MVYCQYIIADRSRRWYLVDISCRIKMVVNLKDYITLFALRFNASKFSVENYKKKEKRQ